MNGITGWDYHPYVPYNEIYRKGEPYISMLAPSENALTFQWQSGTGENGAKVFYRKRGEGEFKE